MKRLLPLLAATVLLAACQPAPTPPAAAAPPAVPNTAASSPAGSGPPAAPAAAMNMSPADHEAMGQAAGPVATASGTVESIDAAAGKITIAHGPVAALNWPPMTMAFAATPEQIAAVKAGQQVDFEFTSEGMNGSLTSIRSR